MTNQYNLKRQESEDYGQKVESLFYQYALKNGNIIRPSSEHENMFKHIDYFLTSKVDGKEYSVDVKGMKKINRQDNNRQDEWIFIEFRNVRGNNGWLYGHAHYIVFETQDSFIFVLRTDLVEICERLVDFDAVVNSSNECAYKVYTRFERNDLVSRIRLSDIPKNKIKVWKK